MSISLLICSRVSVMISISHRAFSISLESTIVHRAVSFLRDRISSPLVFQDMMPVVSISSLVSSMYHITPNNSIFRDRFGFHLVFPDNISVSSLVDRSCLSFLDNNFIARFLIIIFITRFFDIGSITRFFDYRFCLVFFRYRFYHSFFRLSNLSRVFSISVLSLVFSISILSRVFSTSILSRVFSTSILSRVFQGVFSIGSLSCLFRVSIRYRYQRFQLEIFFVCHHDFYIMFYIFRVDFFIIVFSS